MKKRNLKEFHDRILKLDGGICQNCGEPASSAHHIKYRSQDGDESSENGISFCQKCDHKAHHGYTKDGKRVIGHRFVLNVLELKRGMLSDRWPETREELIKVVERLELFK